MTPWWEGSDKNRMWYYSDPHPALQRVVLEHLNLTISLTYLRSFTQHQIYLAWRKDSGQESIQYAHKQRRKSHSSQSAAGGVGPVQSAAMRLNWLISLSSGCIHSQWCPTSGVHASLLLSSMDASLQYQFLIT